MEGEDLFGGRHGKFLGGGGCGGARMNGDGMGKEGGGEPHGVRQNGSDGS
jgi:hypothetical protein